MKKNVLKLAAATILAVSVAVPSAGVFAEDSAEAIKDVNIEETTEKEESTEETTEKEESTEETTEKEESTEETTEKEESTEKTTEKEESTEETTSEDISVDFENSVVINGEKLDSADVVISENIAMIPARKVFEALGYTVEWRGETKTVIVSDLPQYVTFSIGTDGYTIAKTAPMPLNKAPELIDDVTYIPVTLLSEIMGMDVKVDETEPYNVYITTLEDEQETTSVEETTESVSGENSSEETTESMGEKSSDKNDEEKIETVEKNAEVVSLDNDSVLVKDSEKGEVALAIGDDAVIVFDDGTEASVDDIKENSELYVEYGDVMTMSIPPVNNPKKIVIFK